MPGEKITVADRKNTAKVKVEKRPEHEITIL